MSQKLADLAIGVKAKIINIDPSGDRKIRQRLRDMGIVKDQEIYIKKLAPLKDPMEVILKGYSLSLRKKEAELITVEINE